MSNNLDHIISSLNNAIHDLSELRKNGHEGCKSHHELATKADLKELEKKLLMNDAQLETALDNMQTKIGQIAQEQSARFDVLAKTIADLTAALANVDLPATTEKKVTDVTAALANLEASIPNAPGTPPTP